nr:reverse transcriptase domain-containing protein [Tanacetum cinerariifolium]
MAAEGLGDLPVPDLRNMEELCQPSLNGRVAPLPPLLFRQRTLDSRMSIKVNGVTDDALRLYLFPHSLTHHATAWPPEECYGLIENMTAHHNDWDTSAQRSESSSSITSSSDTKIAALKDEMAKINKNLMRNVYAAGAYQGNSYQPQGYRNLLSYYSDNYLGPPGFNQNHNCTNQNQNFHNQNRNQGNHNPQGNNQGRNQFFQGANQDASPQVVTTNEFTNFIKANDATLKYMQTKMTSLLNSNLELKNMFGQFMKMNAASYSGSRTLPGPMIPTTSSIPPVVECEAEATKDKVDFLLEEVDAFLALEDDPTSPKVNQSYADTEGDILLLEAFLSDDPLLPPPNQGNYLRQVQKELKICEAKSDKSSIDEPPECIQTRSSSRLVSNPSLNPNPSKNPNPKGRNRRRSKQRIEEFNLDELSPPIVTMADQRTMNQLLQAPIEDQDSFNSAAGGNFLEKMPRECLAIIERKYKVRYSRNKPFVAKVSTITSTFGISRDVAELKDMVKALLLEKKSQNQSPATVKTVEESCVTYGGAHSYRNCPATDGNIYRDNIQEFISQASAVNYNQGNTSYRPLMMSNQIRPPGFPPVPNNQNVQLNQRNNQNRFNQNQNRGNNFNQGPVYQPPVFQPPAYQAPPYQTLAPQTKGVSKEDFSAYVKANDAVMRNMQTQGQNMQNQLTNLTDLITKFVNSNSASTSSSGTLPSNTIANPRSDLKSITTRSEATKDTVNPTNNESTEDVQPHVVQSESLILNSKPVTSPIFEPVIAPVSAIKPNPKSSIPYPSRRNNERNHEKANNQIEKFYQIFKDMSFEISFTDALILMPKLASILKALIGNKEKLSEMAQTSLNEHCSAVLLKKLPKKLGDPGKFLIPCNFPEMAECLALADLGAGINLMPFSVWKSLSLPDLTPTCTTLKLADRSISRPIGVAEDVYVKVGSFYFSADFVVVDFNADPRVPLIIKRSFLKTERALIDVFEGELTLRADKESITFNLEQTLRYSANYSDMMAKRINVIDMACEEYSQEVLSFYDVISSGNPTPYYDPIVSTTSPTLTPFKNSDFFLEEVDAFLAIKDDPT